LAPTSSQRGQILGFLVFIISRWKKEKAAEFEKFVVEKLHPAVGNVLPDMHLMYYKAVSGDNTASYITIFAISVCRCAAQVLAEGAPETKPLKDAFNHSKGWRKNSARTW
jgi:hypothetical protein